MSVLPFNTVIDQKVAIMSLKSSGKVINLEYNGSIAVITLNKPGKLNALTKDEFYQLAQTLREVSKHDEVVATVLIGNGRFFSA